MKEKVILDLDFNQGAIWTSNQETGKTFTGVACWFNEEKNKLKKQNC